MAPIDSTIPAPIAAGPRAVAAMARARAKQEQHFTRLRYPNRKHRRVFASYVCLSEFAEREGCEDILELGAGLSTAVWAHLAERTGARISTVDADLSRLQGYVYGSEHEAAVSRHVDLIEGFTITAGAFHDFYRGEAPTQVGGVAVADLRDHIDAFQSNRCSIRRRFKLRSAAGSWKWSARDLLTTESALAFPRAVLDIFSFQGDFDNELRFLDDGGPGRRADVASDLVAQGGRWDLVFFDSGELASIIEWQKLKDSIVVGGYAAFHDIFFPKSLKNILVCAAVLADPNWEMVFCDDSTRQGLLIAKRLA